MKEITNAEWGSSLLTACKNQIIPLFAFTFVLHLAASAAVPLRWTVETSRATPAQFEAYQGETLDLEATLQSYGKPVELTGIAALYWQTNGMGSTYWETSAAVNSNRMSAVWTPEMDVGAKVYNCFIGQPGTIYHAAFQLRLRPSPGALPNVLPLPTPVIDFAKVRVLNPPWEGGGGGGGINTNAVIDIIHKTVSGAARPLPKYLHAIDFDDSYPDDAEWYYAQPQDYGSCSARRLGGFLERNYDWKFDDMAEFVVRMAAGPGRYASVGVANCGTNLTEQIVTSGKPSRFYKCLPGHTVDGINENGVVAEINVVDGDPQTSGWHTTGDIHPLGAVRWVLDHATSASMAASNLVDRVKFPEGWTQNFHYMLADANETWIVENGMASKKTPTYNYVPTMTNFPVLKDEFFGEGLERYWLLTDGSEPITLAWFTRAYLSDIYPTWDTDLGGDDYSRQLIREEWAKKPKEAHRGETFGTMTWWQTVHTSIYDLTNRVLKVAVQETDDWYTFQVPSASDADLRRTVGALADSVTDLESSVSGLQSSKLDGPTDPTLALPGKAADAKSTGDALAGKQETLTSQQLANIEDVTNKADKSTTYTRTEIDTVLAGKACASDLESVSSRVERISASVNTNSESISRMYRDVDGKVVNVGGFISSSKPTHYRTGQAGELGTGWAYTAVDGNGLLKYSAFVPTPNVVVTLSGSDPVTEYFGHTFFGRDMVVELTSLTSERGDENGKYDVADFNLSMTNNLPLVISIHRNILDPIARLTGISTEHVSSMYFDTGDAYPYVHHYCYGFSSSLNLVTYYDEWWDDDGNWDTDYRSFTVTATTSGESDYFLVSFGGERLLTESERGDAITELTERTGRRDEAGSGWGYKKYEFKTDRRSWIVKAPDLFAGHSNSVDRSTASNGHIKYTYGSFWTTTYEYDDCPVYTNTFGCSTVFTITEKTCLSTEGKYATDGCSNANYRVSLKFGSSPLIATFDVLNMSISGRSPVAHFVPSSQWTFVEDGTNSYWTSRKYNNVEGDGFFCQSDTYVTSHGYKWYTAFGSFTVRIPCDVDGVVHCLTDGSAAYVPFNASIGVKGTIPGQSDTSNYKFYRSYWNVDLSVNSAFKFIRTGSLSQFEIKAYDLVNDLNAHEFVDETNGMKYEAAVVGGSLVLRAVESED